MKKRVVLFSPSRIGRSGGRVWLVFKEWVNKNPIGAKMKWVKFWGERMEIPCIGAGFVKVRKKQLTEMFDNWDIG